MIRAFLTRPWPNIVALAVLTLPLCVLIGLSATSVAASPLGYAKSARHLKARHDNVIHLVTTYARLHRVPPALAHGIVRIESGYKCGARNPSSSAKGIMQVIDGTARSVGVHGNRLDCRTGLEAGMRVLSRALRQARGNWCGAASIYNRGSGGPGSCTGYGRQVVAQARI